MTAPANSGSLLKACGLWAKVSAKGNQYFVGRWGALRVLVLANNDRQDDSEPSHFLFVAEAPDRPRQAEPKPEQQRNNPRRRPYRGPQAELPSGRPFDDEIPL